MFPYAVAGCFFRYLLYLAQQTRQRLLPVAVRERSGWCCPMPCKRRRSDCWARADELQDIHAKLCEKLLEANLPGVVNHKLWRSQLCEPVPHTPVHNGRSPQGRVVAQEVVGLAVLPGDGTQTSPALEFILAMFGQPLAQSLGVVLAAWHDGASSQDSQFVLQQVEERDRVVKAVHEQHVVLVGDL